MTGLFNLMQAVRVRFDANRLLELGQSPFAVV